MARYSRVFRAIEDGLEGSVFEVLHNERSETQGGWDILVQAGETEDDGTLTTYTRVTSSALELVELALTPLRNLALARVKASAGNDYTAFEDAYAVERDEARRSRDKLRSLATAREQYAVVERLSKAAPKGSGVRAAHVVTLRSSVYQRYMALVALEYKLDA